MQELLNYPMQAAMEIDILLSPDPYALEMPVLDYE